MQDISKVTVSKRIPVGNEMKPRMEAAMARGPVTTAFPFSGRSIWNFGLTEPSASAGQSSSSFRP